MLFVLYFGMFSTCDFVTSSKDVNTVILSYFTFTEVVKYIIPVCKRWNNLYKRATCRQDLMTVLHGLTIPLRYTLIMPEVLAANSSLLYLKLNRTGICEPLLHLECLDVEFVDELESTDFTQINSANFPSLRHLIIRNGENGKYGDLRLLTTLTVYANPFVHAFDYIDKTELFSGLTKLVFHGSVTRYNLDLPLVHTVELHPPLKDVMITCLRQMRKVVVCADPTLECDDFDALYDGRFNTVTLRGDGTHIEELVLTKHRPIGLNRERFPSLRVLRVRPDLVASLQDEFPLVEVAQICSACWEILRERRSCGRCKCTYYCSRGCQIKDWVRHKTRCGFSHK